MSCSSFQAGALTLQLSLATHEISMYDTGRVHVFESTENLIQKVLNELLLQGPRSEQTVQVGSQKFGDEVAGESKVVGGQQVRALRVHTARIAPCSHVL